MYTHIISIYLSRHVNGLKEETETHPISRRSSESYLIENRDVTSLRASFFLVIPLVIQHTYFSLLVDFSKTWLDIHHKSSRFTAFGHVQALKKIGASPDRFYIPVLFWFFCTSLTKRGDSLPKSWKNRRGFWWLMEAAESFPCIPRSDHGLFLRRSTWSTWSINKESQNRHFFFRVNDIMWTVLWTHQMATFLATFSCWLVNYLLPG